MNQTLIKAILLLIAFTLSCHTPLFSQRNFERHEFSFHAGYGVMFHHPPTLTLSTYSYQRTLAQGVSWDGQYNFRPLKRFVFGGIYSGFSSKGSHPEGKDHLWVHFIGTQIGMCNANTKHWQIRVTTGPGGVILRNNSEVFGKTRKVKAFTIGLSLEESTPDFLPKEVIRKGRTIYGFISLVPKSECVMPTPNIGKSA